MPAGQAKLDDLICLDGPEFPGEVQPARHFAAVKQEYLVSGLQSGFAHWTVSQKLRQAKPAIFSFTQHAVSLQSQVAVAEVYRPKPVA